jgi:anti-sigma factor RsiW
MTRQDQIIAVIRTAVPTFVGYLIALLITSIPAVGDVIAAIDEQIAAAGVVGVTVVGLIQAAAVAVVVTLYYLLARWLGTRWPMVEAFLLGSAKTPVYAEPLPARAFVLPLPGETREQYRDRVGEEYPE